MLAISGRPFSGDRLLTRQLAQDHGLHCLEAEVVVERAAARGASHAALWDALLRAPRLADRLLHRGRIPLILLQAALAEEIRAGAEVCWGSIADLLPLDQRHLWVRVHVHAPMKFRVSIAQEQLKLGRREAIDFIEREDRERERWMRHVHGVSYGDSEAYDVVVNLENMNFQEARELLGRLALKTQTDLTDLDDLALAYNVKAALVLESATSHLDLDTAAYNGLVRLSGKVPGTRDLRAAEHAARQVPGVTDVHVEGIKIPSNEGLPAPAVPTSHDHVSAAAVGFRKLWPAGVAVSLLLCLVIVYPWSLRELPSSVANVVSRLAGQGTVYAGYITDTKCGSRVELGMDPDCIRDCVHRDGAVSYALHDGKNLYPLSGDQSAAERYAAERVRITGKLDAERGTLEVMSIEPAT